MNKTISITIARLIFHIEEPAYSQLESYLAAVRLYFSAYEDGEEIARDIENRIAEEFTRRSDGGIRVVTSADVDEVIRQMGTVEDFEYFEGEVREPSSATAPKRLYRDGDNAVFGGVAAGIAAYFGVEVTLVRILFALFAFAYGAGILIYLLLWLAMPEAKTTAQKLQMRGEPLTLAGLEETIRSKAPHQQEVKSGIGRLARGFAGLIRQVGEGLVTLIRGVGHVLIAIVGGGLIIASVLAIAFTTVVFATLVTGTHAAYLDFPLTQVAAGTISYYILLAAGYALVLIPILLILLAGFALARMKKPVNTPVAVALLSAWVVALVVAGIVGLQEGPGYKARYDAYIAGLEQNEKSFAVAEFHAVDVSGGHEVSIVPSEQYFVKAYGGQPVLDRLNVRVDGDQLKVTNNSFDQICFFCSLRSARLEIGMPQPEELQLSGAVQTTLNGFNLDELRLLLSDAARIESDSNITSVDATLSGASRASFTGSITQVEAETSGASTVEIEKPLDLLRVRAFTASKVDVGEVRLIVADLFSGSVLRYFGTPEQADIQRSSGSRAIAE